MKIKELIEILSEMNPELEVILQKDPEGNGYSPLAGAEVGEYLPTSTYSGESIHPDDLGDLEEETLEKLQTVVYFWPVN